MKVSDIKLAPGQKWIEVPDWRTPMVPLSELFGSPVEAYAEGLRADERREVFPRLGWRPCMNCGESRPEVSENGGWCSRCEP